MNPEQTLLLVLLAVYLVECAHWVPRDAVAFVSRARRRFRAAHAIEWAGNRSGGLLFANPLPPLGRFFVVQAWPVSLGAEGAYGCVAQSLHPHGRAPGEARYVRYDAIESVGVSGTTVQVDGVPFVKAASERLARHVADLLLELAEASPGERGPRIEAALDRWTDPAAVSDAVDRFSRETRPLAFACNALAITLGVATPAAIRFTPLALAWPFLVAALLLVVALVLAEFRAAHRALLPDEHGARRRHFWIMLLSPPAAIRARDAISRDLLALHDPLATASVLLAPDAFRRFAARVARDLRHPMRPVCPDGAEEARAAEASFRARLVAALERTARRAGVDPALLAAPPPREGDEDRAFCPRCHALFAVPEGVCADCGGLALERLG